MAEELTRRAFIGKAALFGVGIAASTLGLTQVAFADGAGEGDSTDDDDGNGTPSYYGFEWVWFDQGGFESTEDGMTYVPKQGWNDASKNYFWDGPVANRLNEVGRKLFNDNGSYTWQAPSERNRYDEAANAALAEARRRAGTSRARIVAVGWTCGYFTEGNLKGLCYNNIWSDGRTRNNVLPRNAQTFYNTSHLADTTNGPNFRVGNSLTDLGTGVPNKGGWSDEAHPGNGKTYNTWYDYLWDIYMQGSSASEDEYVFIVLAVADSEPPNTGRMELHKVTA